MNRLMSWPEPVVRVQHLSESGIRIIPERYVKNTQDRPGFVEPDSGEIHFNIPVIDMKDLYSDDAAIRLKTAAIVGGACREWGFFQVVNHGVSHELMAWTQEAWREFFKLPMEEKMKLANSPTTYEGYGSVFGVEKGMSLDWSDYVFLHYLPLGLRDQNKWRGLPISCRVEWESGVTEKMVGPGRPQIVLFGSSIVQMCFNVGGWGAILADLYNRKADILLRGYAGWNSKNALQVLNQIFPQDASVQPSLVIVYYGGNDAMHPHPSGLGPHVPLLEYVEIMKKIALHLKSLSENTRIIFLTSPPVDESMVFDYYGNSFISQARSNESCRTYSEALVELGKHLDIKVIDLWTAFQNRDDWGKAYLLDGIHLTFEGSKIVVKEILKVLQEAEWEPSLHWRSMPEEFEDYMADPHAKTTKYCIFNKIPD